MQRFGSSLNLNIHPHVLMLDGVYVTDTAGVNPPSWRGPATDDQLRHLIEQAACRLIAVLQRRGALDDAQVMPWLIGNRCCQRAHGSTLTEI